MSLDLHAYTQYSTVAVSGVFVVRSLHIQTLTLGPILNGRS